MNFSGFGQGANAGITGAARMNQAQLGGQDLQNAVQQAQARALLTKVLQQYAAQQGQGAAMPSQAPGSPPAPGGVSPTGAMAMPPAGGASGGAGPVPAAGAPSMNPTGAPPMPGMDLQKLAQILGQQGTSGGAQGYAMQDLIKMLQPQQNNAVKIYQTDARDNTSMANTGLRVGATERGQDMNSANVDKRVSATERGQDIGVQRTSMQQKGADGRQGMRDNQADKNNAAKRELAQLKSALPNVKTDELVKQTASLGNVLRGMTPDNPKYDSMMSRFTAMNDELDKRRGAVGLPARTKDASPAAVAKSSFEGQAATDPATQKAVADGTIADDPDTGAAYIAKGGKWQTYK